MEVWEYNFLCIHFVEALYVVLVISFVKTSSYINSLLQWFMVLIFAKQQVLPNSSTPLVPPTILGNFICKCNTNAIGGQLLHGWQWFMGWSMPIPTPIKAIMTLLAFQQMPNLSTTSSSQYPNANNNHPILAIACATQPIPTNANNAKSICTNVAMIRLVCTYTTDMSLSISINANVGLVDMHKW